MSIGVSQETAFAGAGSSSEIAAVSLLRNGSTYLWDLKAHRELYGDLPDLSGDEIVTMARDAGLTGRGGAGFPTHLKLAAVLAKGGPAVVVANGSESEPASQKDKALMLHRPFLVIEGAWLVARTISASRIYLYTHNYRHIHASLQRALAQLRPPGVSIEIVTGPDGYVSGESSAVVSFLNRGVALPTFTRPIDQGVGGLPTAVFNVETLAHLANIARIGSLAFRTLGSSTAPGSRLLTLSGTVFSPGTVVELLHPSPIAEVLMAAGGATDKPVAYLIGGYGGRFTPPMALLGGEPGGSLGCGLVGVIPEGACGLEEACRLFDYLASQSARQCGPCRFGLPALQGKLPAALGVRPIRRAERAVTRLSHEIAGRGGCSHPDAATAMLQSAIATFGEELDLHRNGGCSATRSQPVFKA